MATSKTAQSFTSPYGTRFALPACGRYALMMRFLGACTLALALAFGALAQNTGFADARDLVGRIQQDLKRAADSKQGHKEKDRYANVQKHLSEFDRGLAAGKFDKEKLDGAISDLQNVVEHNTLEPQDRDALSGDLKDLRVLRAKHGNL